jgi:hypothetical protein
MPYRINIERLKAIVSETTLNDDGDTYERAQWGLLEARFPNFEAYWKHFVVPFTKRIQEGIEDENERIKHRVGVDEEIKALGITHYSVFLNLTYAHDHLDNFRHSSFEDFYGHLVTACDLAEEFLTNVYLLTLECRGEQCEVLQKLSREEFLALAGTFYDQRYATLYEHYKRRGRLPLIEVPSKQNILDECFQRAASWREYRRFTTQELRPYRNAVVHRSHMMRVYRLVDNVKTAFVPKKERVHEYRTWSSVEDAARDRRKLESDFAPMLEQMRSDVEHLKTLFNDIWSKPTEEMITLLFKDKNDVLLRKYDLTLE